MKKVSSFRTSCAETASCFIFTGGGGPHKSTVITWDVDLVLAADSGYTLCTSLGYVPDVFMGDMDSVPQEVFSSVPSTVQVYTFNKDKDKTDTELCLQYVKERGYTDISIIGSSVGRVDHFIGLLYLFFDTLAPTRIITEKYHIECITEIQKQYTMNVTKGSIFSVFPFPYSSTQAKSKGLKWELDEITLHNGFVSVSNECKEDTVMLCLQKGAMMAIWEHNNIIEYPTIV